MIIDDSELLRRAEAYAKSNGIRVLRKEKLGHGSDGAVWRTNRPSAVKALDSMAKYQNEVECYKRLAADKVQVICGFHVPLMEAFDDELMVIEMSIVTPPYLLDFGKVWIDRPPPYFFDEQLMENAALDAQELFGSAWPDVEVVLYHLRNKYGIYYVDPRPGNIYGGEQEDEDDRLYPPP